MAPPISPIFFFLVPLAPILGGCKSTYAVPPINSEFIVQPARFGRWGTDVDRSRLNYFATDLRQGGHCADVDLLRWKQYQTRGRYMRRHETTYDSRAGTESAWWHGFLFHIQGGGKGSGIVASEAMFGTDDVVIGGNGSVYRDGVLEGGWGGKLYAGDVLLLWMSNGKTGILRISKDSLRQRGVAWLRHGFASWRNQQVVDFDKAMEIEIVMREMKGEELWSGKSKGAIRVCSSRTEDVVIVGSIVALQTSWYKAGIPERFSEQGGKLEVQPVRFLEWGQSTSGIGRYSSAADELFATSEDMLGEEKGVVSQSTFPGDTYVVPRGRGYLFKVEGVRQGSELALSNQFFLGLRRKESGMLFGYSGRGSLCWRQRTCTSRKEVSGLVYPGDEIFLWVGGGSMLVSKLLKNTTRTSWLGQQFSTWRTKGQIDSSDLRDKILQEMANIGGLLLVHAKGSQFDTLDSDKYDVVVARDRYDIKLIGAVYTTGPLGSRSDIWAVILLSIVGALVFVVSIGVCVKVRQPQIFTE